MKVSMNCKEEREVRKDKSKKIATCLKFEINFTCRIATPDLEKSSVHFIATYTIPSIVKDEQAAFLQAILLYSTAHDDIPEV
jgi:hypothetical protein